MQLFFHKEDKVVNNFQIEVSRRNVITIEMVSKILNNNRVVSAETVKDVVVWVVNKHIDQIGIIYVAA